MQEALTRGRYPVSAASRLVCLISGPTRILAGVMLLLAGPHALWADDLVISEIMYNPPPALAPGSTNVIDGDEFEFLELYNPGTHPVDLEGWSVNDGVHFYFGSDTILNPDAYLLLVENASLFTNRYPSVTTQIAGNWSGKLADGGERITLQAADGRVVFEASYNDSSAWPERADGQGSSMVLLHHDADPNDPRSWGDSDTLFGTPGAAGGPAVTDILLNEVLAHTDPPYEDAIEIINLSEHSINLDGWYLSDSVHHPRKYRITGTVLSPGGYQAWYEFQFNDPAPGGDTNNTTFALSEFGDEIYLCAPLPGTDALRLVDVLRFEATPNNRSIGRCPDGTGDFFLLATNTFGVTTPDRVETFRLGTGAPNSNRQVGPVVINEIMYHPDELEDRPYEYVELHNTGAVEVDLTRWSLGGTGWTNPPGTRIAANGYLVVAADRNRVASKYGMGTVLGNWPGHLQNDGEALELRDADGVVMDRIRYDDHEPWPAAADGLGPSLERINPNLGGDTALNWSSSMVTTNWYPVVRTQYINNVDQPFTCWIDEVGTCYLDDVSVVRASGGSNQVPNGDFEAGDTGWTYHGNHASSRVEDGVGRGGSKGLVVAGAFSRTIITPGDLPRISYGDGVEHGIQSSTIPVGRRTYVISYWIRREGLSIGHFVSRYQSTQRQHFLGHRGTPGARNSVFQPIDPVGISDVAHDRNIVESGEANTIRARVYSEAGMERVDLLYRIVESNRYDFTDADYISLAMVDDGVGADLMAGDGEYTARIPGTDTNRSVVRYRVQAVASNGSQRLSPRFDDPSRDYGYWVESSPLQTVVPNWHILVDGGPVTHPITKRCIAVSPQGQVFPDVWIRHRGRPSSSSSGARRTGVALRFHNGRRYDAWFGEKQNGTNFRHREDVSDSQHQRTVNEYLAYRLSTTIGLPAPFNRHVCIWIDSEPTITLECEAPQEGFLKSHGLPGNDYLSRSGYTGRRFVDGQAILDNWETTLAAVDAQNGSGKPPMVRSRLWYEKLRYAVALRNLVGDGDQHAEWNMFQHRSATNGLWTIYPWDVDLAFVDDTDDPIMDCGSRTPLPYLHPYYQTSSYPSIWDCNSVQQFGETLFAGTASSSLPYRHRHQKTLWRYCHTLFTTNYLGPLLEQLESDLVPAFQQIDVVTGQDESHFTTQIQNVKNFIEKRRAFLVEGNWPDKMSGAVWDAVYAPPRVVISEIMANPDSGGEYLELYNDAGHTVDLSWWELRAGQESYRLPHGTMLAPTSRLVVADSQVSLTHAYADVGAPDTLVHRMTGIPLWDAPLDFLSGREYATRVVEEPRLTLPASGTTVSLHDLRGQTLDTVTYEARPPWPMVAGASLELLQVELDNQMPGAWRSSFRQGTPGTANTATNDIDNDHLVDQWEGQVLHHYGHLTSIDEVLPEGDEDQDGLPNRHEFLLGLDPTRPDGSNALIRIARGTDQEEISFETRTLAGPGYAYYRDRRYTLAHTTSPYPAHWQVVSNYNAVSATGLPVVHTNTAPAHAQIYRYEVELQPDRP